MPTSLQITLHYWFFLAITHSKNIVTGVQKYRLNLNYQEIFNLFLIFLQLFFI